jgi:hypothetical protein
MRFAVVVLILGVALPAWAVDKKSPKGQCSDRCQSTYQFCLNRATTKDARKACKVNKKPCKKQCSPK